MEDSEGSVDESASWREWRFGDEWGDGERKRGSQEGSGYDWEDVEQTVGEFEVERKSRRTEVVEGTRGHMRDFEGRGGKK